MPAGRPTDYNKDTVKKVQEYLDSCRDIKIGKNQFDVNLPTTEGLALYLGIHRDTLYEWARNHPEFSDIFDRCKQEQANRVINGSMAGKYNPLISKLLLGKHGYKEQVGLSGEGEGEGVKLDVDIKDSITKIYGPKEQ